jgi:hypothetical protein
MSSRSLDPVLVKIDTASSTQNLYRSLTLDDRITMQSTPLSNNSTGSAKGLVSELTPSQFQAFDMGRETYTSIAQEQNCFNSCMQQCPFQTLSACQTICNETCSVDTTKDFI